MHNCSLDFNMSDEKRIHKDVPSQSIFSSLFNDKDTVLILALILLLYSDNCDRLLILALFYIIT